MSDTFGARGSLQVGGSDFTIYRLSAVARKHASVDRLPRSLKVLLENLLRFEDGRVVRPEDVQALATWDAKAKPSKEIAYHPARVLLQDFTGVPAIVDLAAMREAFAKMGGSPDKINPLSPADLVIDHSVIVDQFGATPAFGANVALEHERNKERYGFLRWGQQAFRNLRIVPPGTGICHQVNLEFLAQVVFRGAGGVVYPDTLVGTDSHTTMVNGLGVFGWGVGGIEAEAALLGQPLSMLIPEVIGFRLVGEMKEGATATDVVLTVTQLLRKKGVVGKFVEYFGPGVGALALADRATIANMAPEYGATMGFFPVDEQTLAYLRFSNRPKDQVALVEAFCKEQGIFRTDGTSDPVFSDTLELDLSTVEPSLAGPKRPQDRVLLREAKAGVRKVLADTVPSDRAGQDVHVGGGPVHFRLGHGTVVIAAITSCTNTSNPSVMLGAGILAKKAVERGLKAKPWVKTSLAPGSQVVGEYFRASGLTPYLEALGFHLVGHGCTTCIGNSGPLPQAVADAVKDADLHVAAVLSGNRNFEGRINPQVRLNYLASPPLVVAYAIAGTMDVDLATEPLGEDPNGTKVYLKDVWPTRQELQDAMASVQPSQFQRVYERVLAGDERWRALDVPKGQTFTWDPKSTYVRRPTFFEDLPKQPKPLADVQGARVLALLGDSVTTDHISPAGSIHKDSPAAKYLRDHGVDPKDFNQYGARRGNHEVMVRGTFANIRLRNLLVPGTEGGVTVHLPDAEKLTIYDAAMRYQAEKVPLVVLAGAEYGTGSSRDWAAKGTMLLGVRAVIAKSFERIHRSNLVGMGVLPLQFDAGQDVSSLGLTGREKLDVQGIAGGVAPGARLTVKATADGGAEKTFQVTARVDTPNEADYFRHGGILQFVMRQLLAT